MKDPILDKHIQRIEPRHQPRLLEHKPDFQLRVANPVPGNFTSDSRLNIMT